MLTAPLPVGLSIVIPVIRIGGTLGFLPTALALPLAFIRRTEFLIGRLWSGMKEFVAGCTTLLFHG
jgi:hypothetical protein